MTRAASFLVPALAILAALFTPGVHGAAESVTVVAKRQLSTLPSVLHLLSPSPSPYGAPLSFGFTNPNPHVGDLIGILPAPALLDLDLNLAIDLSLLNDFVRLCGTRSCTTALAAGTVVLTLDVNLLGLVSLQVGAYVAILLDAKGFPRSAPIQIIVAPLNVAVGRKLSATPSVLTLLSPATSPLGAPLHFGFVNPQAAIGDLIGILPAASLLDLNLDLAIDLNLLSDWVRLCGTRICTTTPLSGEVVLTLDVNLLGLVSLQVGVYVAILLDVHGVPKSAPITITVAPLNVAVGRKLVATPSVLTLLSPAPSPLGAPLRFGFNNPQAAIGDLIGILPAASLLDLDLDLAIDLNLLKDWVRLCGTRICTTSPLSGEVVLTLDVNLLGLVSLQVGVYVAILLDVHGLPKSAPITITVVPLNVAVGRKLIAEPSVLQLLSPSASPFGAPLLFGFTNNLPAIGDFIGVIPAASLLDVDLDLAIDLNLLKDWVRLCGTRVCTSVVSTGTVALKLQVNLLGLVSLDVGVYVAILLDVHGVPKSAPIQITVVPLNVAIGRRMLKAA